MARSVTELALLLDATAGYDPKDPQTAASVGNIEGSFLDALDPEALRGKRIGMVSEMRYRDADDGENDPKATYLEEFSKRTRLASAIFEVMAKEGLDELAYPTMRQVAAEVSEEQSGENCHPASNSGFPVITVPAGFTAEGLPVGLEFLGRPWNDAPLLGLAFAFEQSTRHRRPPRLRD